MIAAPALSTGAPTWAVRAAQSEIVPTPIVPDMWSLVRVLLISIVVVSFVALLVAAVRTVTFRGTWTESLDTGPAKLLIGSTVVLLTTSAAVTVLDWTTVPGT